MELACAYIYYLVLLPDTQLVASQLVDFYFVIESCKVPVELIIFYISWAAVNAELESGLR